MALFPTEDNWQRYRWIRNVLKETNDCAVIALAQATGKTYQDCHAACEKHGRIRRKGFCEYGLLKALHDLDFKHELVVVNGLAMHKVIPQLSGEARYIIGTPSHWTAYVFGKWLDHTPIDARHCVTILKVTPV